MKESILITGSNGFIGALLKFKLSKKYNISDLDVNLNDQKAVIKRMRKINPNYVIHLSAVTTPAYYFDYPVETLQRNFIATANLAEVCKTLKNFKQFIFPSSVAVYAPIISKRLNEFSKLQPLSSHGVAKVACEHYLEYLGKVYNFPYTILRLTNIYGRKDDDRYFIEKTVSCMLKGDDIKLGNSDAVRDWLYIDDAIDAFIKILGNKDALEQTFLIGTGKGYSTKQVANKIAKLIGFKKKVQWQTEKRNADIARIVCDSNKASKILGWKPKVNLEQGLKKTIEKIKTQK